MKKRCVAVVDASRARLFQLGTRETPTGEEVPRLEEVETLANPAMRLRDEELYSDSRPGIKREFAGGPGHGVDDKRDAHSAELERRFATEVADAISRVAGSIGARRVVLCASPEMLGYLREQKSRLGDLAIDELAKNLAQLSPTELYDHLQSAELLPPRR